MSEEWVTFVLFGRDTLRCENCSGLLDSQKVYLCLNVDHEVEEVLCAECYKSRRV